MTQDLPDLTREDDLCPDCGELLDYWGECPNGCRQVDYDEDN